MQRSVNIRLKFLMPETCLLLSFTRENAVNGA